MARLTSERRFQEEFQDAARELGFHVVPIPDIPRTRGMRFLVVRVYDLGMVDPCGNYHGIEIKQVRRKDWGWSFKELSELQEESLLEADRLAAGWLLIHHVAQLSARNKKRFGFDNFDRAWMVPIGDALAARDREGLDTLDPEWLITNGIEIMRRGEWNFMDFVDHVELQKAGF